MGFRIDGYGLKNGLWIFSLIRVVWQILKTDRALAVNFGADSGLCLS